MSFSREFFCYLTPARPNMHGNVTEDEMEIFGRHTKYLDDQFKARRVLQAGTSFEPGQEHFAIVIFNAPDKRAAEDFMNADPAVAKGLLNSRVTEYSIYLDRGASKQG